MPVLMISAVSTPIPVPKTRIVIDKYHNSAGTDYGCGSTPFTYEGATFTSVGGGGNTIAYDWHYNPDSRFDTTHKKGWRELIIKMNPETDTIQEMYIYRTAKTGKNAGKEVRKNIPIPDHLLIVIEH